MWLVIASVCVSVIFFSRVKSGIHLRVGVAFHWSVEILLAESYCYTNRVGLEFANTCKL
jgi:hypothetical protein